MSTPNKISPKEIALMGIMIAVIEACKAMLLFLPNIELTSFLIVVFTVFFRKRIFPVILGFILVEGVLYGFGLWWIMYLYVWPILCIVAFALKDSGNRTIFAIISGAFGLLFGALCSIPYFFIGLSGGGMVSGISTAFTWWVAGIPWDLVHGIGNFFIMFFLYDPVMKLLSKIRFK